MREQSDLEKRGRNEWFFESPEYCIKKFDFSKKLLKSLIFSRVFFKFFV
jgi:hypothetical protein